jgi:hypothetical protein
MARVEKGSRLRGVPARVRLNIQDNFSGSFPVRVRTSYDGRSALETGRHAFNDSTTLIFNSASNMHVGSGLPSGSRYASSELRTTFPFVSGPIRAGVADSWVDGPNNPSQPIFTPFKDSGEPTFSIRRDDAGAAAFYATGSAVSDIGPGFQNPLWSKTKMVVSIPVNGTITMSLTKGAVAEQDFPMAYHNFDTGKFYYPGSGAKRESYAADETGAVALSQTKCMGFFGSRPSNDISTSSLGGTLGAVGNVNGFPFDSKYFVPKTQSGVLYSLSESIAEPFLAEKIVVEFSGSFEGLGLQIPADVAQLPTYVSFFVMNQRNIGSTDSEYSYQYLFGAFPEATIAASHLNGTMDLVTYAQIVSFQRTDVPINAALGRELNLSGSSYDWSGRYTVSGSVKGIRKYGDVFLRSGPQAQSIVFGNPKGGRLGTGAPCGRNYRNTMASYAKSSFDFAGYTLETVTEPTEVNPYLLFPTDTLVFGWQTAVTPFSYLNSVGNADWPSTAADYCSRLSISGSVKVTIYGSHLRMGDSGKVEEHHDTLNQLVSSNAIQEMIG